MTDNQSDLEVAEKLERCSLDLNGKVHVWRICPIGKHYVRAHSLYITPSKAYPAGHSVMRREHCAANPSHKDMLSYDEIQAIAKTHFSNLAGPPRAGILTNFHEADNFDQDIRGWVRYWNDVFKPKEPLDPNLIKALIATESGFDIKIKDKTKKIHPHGLMQIINKTLHILGDHQGELKDHLIYLTEKDLLNPSANICAGVRWLFRTKEIASGKLGRAATWEEAVAAYKSYLNEMVSGKNKEPKAMQRFREYYRKLQE